jgi:hypothetical protein
MKLPQPLFQITNTFFSTKCRPEFLFIVSLFALAFFVFIKNTTILWIITGFFFILTLARRGSVHILPSLLLTLCLVFFAILTPTGKVLYSVGSFRITLDALNNGLHRSAVLVGMVFISQFAISKNLQLPGSAGKFLTEVFGWFDKLTASRISFVPGKIIASIDAVLVQLWANGSK